MNNKTFKLFACCQIVKGASLATICDLHRGRIYSIPLELAEFLEESQNYKTLDYMNSYSAEDKNTIHEYIDFLEQNELGFWTDEPKKFPNLDIQWKSPEHINNAVIEIEELSHIDIQKITEALKNLYCKFVEIRFYKKADVNQLDFFLDYLSNSVVKSVTVYIPDTKKLKIEDLNEVLRKYPRVRLVVLHSSTQKQADVLNSIIKVTPQKIDNRSHCGIIDASFFSVNIPFFTESLQFNSCLNKKMSIDKDGNIKNCPSMATAFGNIKTDNIEQIVHSRAFQKLWGIGKKSINVCKDCEYRSVCSDCRAYVDDPKDIYSKPLKCGYDPYTNKWEDWSSNPLKEKSINYYQMNQI